MIVVVTTLHAAAALRREQSDREVALGCETRVGVGRLSGNFHSLLKRVVWWSTAPSVCAPV